MLTGPCNYKTRFTTENENGARWLTLWYYCPGTNQAALPSFLTSLSNPDIVLLNNMARGIIRIFRLVSSPTNSCEFSGPFICCSFSSFPHCLQCVSLWAAIFSPWFLRCDVLVGIFRATKPAIATCCWIVPKVSSLIFKKYFIFRKRGREGKEREWDINVWLPLKCPLLGTWPATQACALTGNWTNALVSRPVLNPLIYTIQGLIFTISK